MATLDAYVEAPSRRRGLTVFSVTAARGPSLEIVPYARVRSPGVLSLRTRWDADPTSFLVRNRSSTDVLILPGDFLYGEGEGRVATRSFLLGGRRVAQIPAGAVDGGSLATSVDGSGLVQLAHTLPLRDNQIGFLVFRGSRLLGLEALGSPELYRAAHRSLMVRFFRNAVRELPRQSVASGLLRRRRDHFLSANQDEVADLENKAAQFVDALRTTSRYPTPRTGLGTYWTLEGPVVGSELIHRGTLIHLSARPMSGESGASGEGRSQLC